MPEFDTRPQYPIRAVALRTGLSPHVLRAWEKRYGAVKPARPGGRSRLYSIADIEHLKLLRRLTEAGHAIGRIAAMPVSELRELVETESAASAGSSVEMVGSDQYVAEALGAVSEMDAEGLQAILMRALVALGSKEFIDGVVLVLLHRVGDLWKESAICPAHEHVLSVQVSRVLGWLADTTVVPSGAPNAVAFTPAGQRHEFGAMLAGLIAAEAGWRVTYAGPELGAGDIAAAVEARNAEMVLLSVLVEDQDGSLPKKLRELRAAIGEGPLIFVGGKASGSVADAVNRAGAEWLPDLAALRRALRATARNVSE
ncbi:MAG TPA: MerR family transcriptional regulator [Longimicrobiaceae bacterium]|nr:MerR family transcriptional regulator [Longimicrobiaceae bacterium]